MALSSLSSLTDITGQSSSTPATSSTPAASTSTTAGPSWLSGSLSQVALILLGLLLIAAGIFSFDKTKELVVSGAKKGAELAAA